MTKLKVRLTKEQAAQVFWESYSAWEKCLHDEGKKAAFIAGYITGWERNERPALPAENVVPVDF